MPIGTKGILTQILHSIMWNKMGKPTSQIYIYVYCSSLYMLCITPNHFLYFMFKKQKLINLILIFKHLIIPWITSIYWLKLHMFSFSSWILYLAFSKWINMVEVQMLRKLCQFLLNYTKHLTAKWILRLIADYLKWCTSIKLGISYLKTI